MTIILIKIDAHEEEQRYLPYGPLYIADSLEKEGYEVKILHNAHLHSLDRDLKKFRKIIKKEDPLFVSFSVNTGRSTVLSAEFSEMIKKDNEDIPIVWGGVHPTLLPQQCLSEHYIDIVGLEEGEETVVEIAQSLEGKRRLSDVKGIGYKKDGKPLINPLKPKIKDLDKYRPAWHLIDLNRYLNKYKEYGQDFSRMISYMTSRGCPYRCAFCYNQSWHNQQMRYHSIERVISDIKWLKDEYSVDAIVFHDDNFFVNRKRAFKIIEEVDLPWFGEPRIDYITEKFAKKIGETNCINLLIGAESGSNRILQEIRKDITVAQIEKATKIMAKYKVPVAYSWVVGFPGERWGEIMQTLRFIDKLQKYYANDTEIFHNRVGIYLPYPGTYLYDSAIENGFQPPANTKEWGKLMRYKTGFDLPWLDKEKMNNLIRYMGYAGRARYARYNLRFDLKVISKLYEYRLKKGNFSFAFEIKLYSILAENIANILKKYRKT